MPLKQQLKLPEEGSLAASTIPSGDAVPSLLYLADVPVESYMHGSSLVYRLFESYPAENADRGRLVRIPGRPPPTKCPVSRNQIKLVPVAEKSVPKGRSGVIAKFMRPAAVQPDQVTGAI